MKLPKIIIFNIFMLISCWSTDLFPVTHDFEREAAILDRLRAAVDQYGPRDYNTAPFRLELANYYLDIGEYPKAEPLFHQVIRMLEIQFGPNSSKLIPVLEKMASLDLRKNRFAFALNQYSRARAISVLHYGSQSKHTNEIDSAISETRRAEREWKRYGGRQIVSSPVVTASVQEPTSPTVIRVEKPESVQPSPAVQKVTHKPPVVQQAPAVDTHQKPTVPINKNSFDAAIIDSEGVPREPPAENKRGYYVSMGCFSDKPFAINQTKRVLAIPVPVYLKSIRNDSLHCVFGGPFESKIEAQQAAELSREIARVADTIVKKYQ
ncbi:MAG: hypothetical protein HQL67_06715 [Magnetococcales bacterium]|nr:hypothetical protein [Magnetococcales bacterium]